METDITAGKMEDTSQMFSKSTSVYYGTVAPYPHFSASSNAAALEKAIEAKGVDEDMTMTVLVKRIYWAYESQHCPLSQSLLLTDVVLKDLDKVIKCETSGDFAPAILALLKTDRSEDTDVDIDLAKKGTRAVFEAGENTKGTDVAVFIDIPAAGAAHRSPKVRHINEYKHTQTQKACRVSKIARYKITTQVPTHNRGPNTPRQTGVV
uniref:Uncharacterized protein n=1 Tax=Oncorhynchus tshawytscha TaxID=74940 RepID=A0A8C8F0V4_ONCTS